jgi:hypothetical protein
MKKLLIINRAQFGYHIDSYKYCQYLKDQFEVTYICFDSGKDKVEESGVNIIYVPYNKSFIKKGISFIQACRGQIKNNTYDIVFIVYFLMSSFIKIGFKKENFILDIRTGSVNQSSKKRFTEDTILKLESLFFKNITIISECLRKKLKLNGHILPLGSDPFSNNIKSYDNINLLYVGTLNGRDIYKTVLGLSDFLKQLKEDDISLKITYDIIGFGTTQDETILKNTIQEENLNDIVVFHGRKMHNELIPYFNKANIGVSYVPITEHYQCQPPTKTFEYINSGLYCIGTNTNENKNLINENNGILCNDSIESFSHALMTLINKKNIIDSLKVSKSLKQYYWKEIVEQNLLIYMESFFEEKK